MELPPVLDHLVELSVTVSIPLHFLDICSHELFVFFKLLLHVLEVLRINFVLLDHVLNLLLIVLCHAVIALHLAQPRDQLQILFLGV